MVASRQPTKSQEWEAGEYFYIMKNVISISEVVQSIAWENGAAELCVSAEATFDSLSSQVLVALDSFISPVDISSPGRRVRAPWLLPSESVRASASSDEASAVARDIFHNWVKRVRQTAPPSVSL